MKSNSLLGFFILFQTFIQAQKIEFKDFPVPEISIRALEVVNKQEIWFAGSNGKYGRVYKDILQVDTIKKLDNKLLQFRSIAYNKKDIFILSIESPALMYRINVRDNQFKPEVVFTEDHPKAFYDSMTFSDENNGIALGDPTEKCLSVLLTNDAGRSWEKLSCEDLPDITEGEACFAASNTNISTYKDNIWMVTGGSKARVFHSSNKGKSWKVYSTPIIQGGKMTGIYSVDFYDSKNGIIMGGDWENKSGFKAAKAITGDGGRTWKLINNNNLPGYISCVQYFPNSGSKILAVSTEGIYFSEDTGNSWKKISDRPFYTVRFSDKNTAWLSGNNLISRLTFKN